MDINHRANLVSQISNIDWDFFEEKGSLYNFNIHWYPARLIPQIAGSLISLLSTQDDCVLDPFCGSGTTLLEANKYGRKLIGIDLNPIATLICRATLTNYDSDSFDKFQNSIDSRISLYLNDEITNSDIFDHSTIPNFEENSQWYHPKTLFELSVIFKTINEFKSDAFFWGALSTFSSILHSVSSQDKHWGWVCDNVKPKQQDFIYKDAIAKFKTKLKEYKQFLDSYNKEKKLFCESQYKQDRIQIFEENCISKMKILENDSIDLVVTSPPYFNMTDYILAQRLTFLWLPYDKDKIRISEIGARYKRARKSSLDDYLADMHDAFTQIARLLKPGKFCCIIIGESHNHQSYLKHFEAICEQVGLKKFYQCQRKIPAKRSLFPVLQNETINITQKI